MTAHPSLGSLEHRPWPLPESDWRWRQTWHDLLFMHWPVAPADLGRLLPPSVELDTWDGDAWIGVVPFRMSDVMLRGIPAVPGLSAFPEINVRTYVRVGDRPGVWFLSLDAGNGWAVKAARLLFHLPYYHAEMSCIRHGGQVLYESSRREAPPAGFRASYGGGPLLPPAGPGTLEHWLTERYALFTTDPSGRLFTADIHHAPWPLQEGEAAVEENTMLAPWGIEAEGAPLLHFASRIEVVVWSLQPV